VAPSSGGSTGGNGGGAAPGGGGACSVQAYGQCGGDGYSGCTECAVSFDLRRLGSGGLTLLTTVIVRLHLQGSLSAVLLAVRS
jgi:hypothetical protein